MSTLFSELRRRHVFKVAAAYGIVAWLVVQAASIAFPAFDAPAWVLRVVIALAVLGFPVALVLAWAFELTSDGIRRAPSATPLPGWLGAALLVVLLLAGGVYVGIPRAGGAPADRLSSTAELGLLTQLTFSEGIEESPAFSADGERVAFSREIDGFKQIYIRSLATDQEQQVTHEPLDHVQPTWSPDGTTLVYVQAGGTGGKLLPSDVFNRHLDGDLWRLDLPTGARQRIARNASNPSFSPDGSRIAFDGSWAGAVRIWTSDPFGRNPQQVTTDDSEAILHVAPEWSPDGRRLVFQSIEKTKFDVRVVDLETRTIASVTDDLFADLDPVWSPGGDEILFSSPRGGGFNLWRVPVAADGSPRAAPRQITTGAGQDLNAAFSPDGSRVAFTILAQNSDLWRLPVSPETGEPTGDPERLIATTREESRGAWSPDGRRVAFNSDRAGEMNLWIHSLEDDVTRQVTSGPGGDYQPRWSPDGRVLVFFSSRSGNADIWSVEVQTGQLRQLTRDPALDVNPFVSPDGRSIAFHSDRGGRKELWVMDADGGSPRQLTTGGADDHYLAWAADSRSILARTRAGVRQIFLDGQEERELEVRGGAHLSFSPDQSLLADVVDHRALWISPVGGGEARKIFQFDDPDVRMDYPTWSPDGRWILFDRQKPTGGDIWILRLEGIARPH